MEKETNNSGTNFFIGFIVIVTIVLLATLPFHYVFYYGQNRVFAKENFSFKNTFSTETDIENIISKYNNSNLFEAIAMLNDPFIKTLVENGIIQQNTKEKTENEADEGIDSSYSGEENYLKIDETKVLGIINKYYSASLQKEYKEFSNIFANPTENYFGKTDISPMEIIESAKNYYEIFTFTQCEIDPHSLKITKNMSQIYTAEYTVNLIVKNEKSGKSLNIVDKMTVKIDEFDKICSIVESIVSKIELD